MSDGIHVGDVGIRFSVLIDDENGDSMDVSLATSKDILFRKPSGEIVSLPADCVNDCVDGLIEVITTDELDESGIWAIQARIEIGESVYSSSVSNFTVFPNVDS
jgi:hypothetical protein